MGIAKRAISKLAGRRFRFKIFRANQKEVFFETGWYHPMPIKRGGKDTTTHTEFGIRSSYPFIKSDVLPELWEEFIRNYETEFNLDLNNKPFDNLKVWDIGPAEGLFTYLSVRNGAQIVEVVQSQNLMADRFLTFFGANDLLDKVRMNFGYFPSVIPEQKPDLIICAGVLYHAENIADFLEEILERRVPIFLETTIDVNESNYFDPSKHNDGYSRNTTLHLSWLKREVKNKGFKLIELEIYNSYCQKIENFAPNRNDRHGTPSIRRWSALIIPNSSEY